MNILVCIKQVPGSNQVEVDPKTGVLKRDNKNCKMNPYDLYAIETALRLKEELGAKVTVLTMGPKQAEEVIKEAYSMGADDGVLLSDRAFAGADVLSTSYTMSQGVKKALPDFDLIICGKQTTDGDTAQVGSELAEFLGIPSVNNVLSIESIDAKHITVSMDLESQIQVFDIQLPCLISVEKNIYQPRFPSYIKRGQTKDQPYRVYTLKDLEDQDDKHYGLNGSPTQVRSIYPPHKEVKQQRWTQSGDELGKMLYGELQKLKFIVKAEGKQS